MYSDVKLWLLYASSGKRPTVKDCAWAGQRHGRLRFPVPFTHPKYVVASLAQESYRVWMVTTYASGLFADGVVFSCYLRGESGILDGQWLGTGFGRESQDRLCLLMGLPVVSLRREGQTWVRGAIMC